MDTATHDRNIATWLGDAPQPVRDTTNQLLERIALLRAEQTIYPAQDDILNALAYTPVDQVKVVLPEETDDLTIVQGQDYCTLVTCTPYAINTHRMLVRGTRVPYNGEEETGDTPQVVQYQALHTGTVVKRIVDAWPWISVTGSVIIGGEALLLLLLLHRCKKREEDD